MAMGSFKTLGTTDWNVGFYMFVYHVVWYNASWGYHNSTYSLVNVYMGKLTISMAMFNSYEL